MWCAWIIPKWSPPSSLWKNHLPWNQSLMPRWLQAAALEQSRGQGMQPAKLIFSPQRRGIQEVSGKRDITWAAYSPFASPHARIYSPHYPCSIWSTLCVLRCYLCKASSQAPCLWPLIGSDKAEAQQIWGGGGERSGCFLPAPSLLWYLLRPHSHGSHHLLSPCPPAFEAVTASCCCDLDTSMPLSVLLMLPTYMHIVP